MLGLLLAPDQTPLPAGIDPQHLEGQQTALPQARVLLDLGADPNDLPAQRWSIIAPRGPQGDAAIEALGPLIHRRSEEQGAPVSPLRPPPTLAARELPRWIDAILDDEAIPATERPRYLLVLGAATDLPLGLAEALTGQRYVGRLPWLDPAPLRAFQDKALAPAPRSPAPIDLFGVEDGGAATRLGLESLLRPAQATLAAQAAREAQDDPTRLLTGADAAGLRALLAQAATARLLFTLGHGRGPGPAGWQSPAHAQARQGALTLGAAPDLDAEALAATPFAPNGLWIHLACYGAATPATSAYAPWLQGRQLAALLGGLPPAGAPPFFAGPAAAALASPQGPRAILSHADLAFTHAFRAGPSGSRPRSSRFATLLSQARRGDRLGPALASLHQAWISATSALTSALDPSAPPSALDQGLLWLQRADLGGYLLLGDPASRLVDPAGPASHALSVEQAILRLLTGQDPGPLAAAAGLPVDRLRALARAYQAAGRATLSG